MSIRVYKPTTNGRRNMSVTDYSGLSKVAPERSLLAPLSKNSGRNSYGRITVRHRGGGNRRKYRIIDFKRDKFDVSATVKTLEYDPNRSAHIALLEYADGEKSYILAPNGLQVGQTVMSGAGVAPEVGNTLFLSEIPLGTVIHNIELYPGQGAAMARSAGSYAQLLAREGKFAVIKLPSGETRMVLVTCRATVGVVSNVAHSLESSGKAGRERWLGRRPRNRGVVMNPVDHPMGGGEGRASGGHPRSRKGLLAKGYKTRNPKKTTSKFIISRKKK